MEGFKATHCILPLIATGAARLALDAATPAFHSNRQLGENFQTGWMT